MNKQTLYAVFLVVLILCGLHFLVHIDLDQPPPRVILSIEVGVMGLIFVAVMWEHIIHLFTVITGGHGPAPSFSPATIYAIMWAFIASVSMYLASAVVLHYLR